MIIIVNILEFRCRNKYFMYKTNGIEDGVIKPVTISNDIKSKGQFLVDSGADISALPRSIYFRNIMKYCCLIY